MSASCSSQLRTSSCICCTISACLPGCSHCVIGRPLHLCCSKATSNPSCPATAAMRVPSLYTWGRWALLQSNAAEPCMRKIARGDHFPTWAFPSSRPKIPPHLILHLLLRLPPVCQAVHPALVHMLSRQHPVRLRRCALVGPAGCHLQPGELPQPPPPPVCHSCHLVACSVEHCLQPLDGHKLPAGAEAQH